MGLFFFLERERGERRENKRWTETSMWEIHRSVASCMVTFRFALHDNAPKLSHTSQGLRGL